MRGIPELIDFTGERRLWSDADDAEARVYIESHYGIANKQKSDDAFRTMLQQRQYNPVQELVRSIKWDKQKRCEEFLIRWAGAEDTLYTREVTRLLFAGGISRAFKPGCKFDCVPVLIGKQGGGKSTLVNWLALDDYFYSSTTTINGQKGLESISGKWIVELEELIATIANDKAGTKQEDYTKAFITTRQDTYRRPYDRRPGDYQRTNIFVGTTNRETFLTDSTGNRRWYPVKVQIDTKTLYHSKGVVKEEILQCWAEMYQYFIARDKHAVLIPNDEILQEIQQRQEEAETEDYREGMIAEYVAGKERVCIVQICRS